MKKFLKLCNHSKVKMVIILTFLFFVYTTICAISYANDISTDIAGNVRVTGNSIDVGAYEW